MLTATEVLALRMRALMLAGDHHSNRTVAGIVEWFGAMQAQELPSVLWSLGARIPGSTEADIAAALEGREALRTWPMRGTIHLVPSRDARWMLEVLGARPLAQAANRRANLGLEESTANRGVEVLGSALAGGQRRTRAACLDALATAGIETSGQIGYHLLWFASQRGVTCITPNVDGEQTFALLDDWVPNPHTPSREEALATIALRFFQSHGPASRADFVRWTRLTVADAKAGIAGAASALVEVETTLGTMLASSSALDDQPARVELGPPSVLPGYDEYMLGYVDRSFAVDGDRLAALVPGGNGVFQATLVNNGRVVGTWKRSNSATTCSIQAWTWDRGGTTERTGFDAAFERYGAFIGRTAKVTWTHV